jgi:hypothetical protein
MRDRTGDLDQVTYCGLYCPLCAERGRIPRQASILKESMAKEGGVPRF